jgi:hypothetical protein
MDWMEAEENCKHLISTDFKGVLMEIHIPAGVPILSWDYLSDEPDIGEMVLPRNGRFNIVSIETMS